MDAAVSPWRTGAARPLQPAEARRLVRRCRALLAPVVGPRWSEVDLLLLVLVAEGLDETTGARLALQPRAGETPSALATRVGKVLRRATDWLGDRTGAPWSPPALDEATAVALAEALGPYSLLRTAGTPLGPAALVALFRAVHDGPLPAGSRFAAEPAATALLDATAFRAPSERIRALAVAATKAFGALDRLKARNIDWIRGAYKRGDTELANLPKLLQVEISTVCNLRCRMCSISGDAWGRTARFMDLATIERLRPALAYVSDCKIHGDGEPFLHPRIRDVISIFAEEGVRLNTVTNATVLTPELAALIGETFSSLTISLDAVDPATWEEVRARGRWERFVRGVELVEQHRRPGMRLIFGAVLLRCNIEQLADMVRFAHDRGADEFQAAWMVPFEDLTWTHTQGLTEDPVLTNRNLDEARAVGAELGISVRIPDDLPVPAAAGVPVALGRADAGPERGADRAGPLPSTIVALDFEPDDYDLHGTTKVTGHCRLMYDRAMVRVDGEVKPCGQSIPLPALGSVHERSFRRCWNSDAYQELRATFNGGTLPPTCRRCNFIRSKQLGPARLVYD